MLPEATNKRHSSDPDVGNMEVQVVDDLQQIVGGSNKEAPVMHVAEASRHT